MYEVKSKIFLELSKTQKSALCNFIRTLTKKMSDASVIEIFNKFVEDEQYYLKISASRFEFLADQWENSKFLKELELYINECKKYYDYKKKQEPVIKANKELAKRKRKFLQELKLSKELPTKKQISYYNSLCRRYNIHKKDLSESSKLDLRNYIEEIINEHKTN